MYMYFRYNNIHVRAAITASSCDIFIVFAALISSRSCFTLSSLADWWVERSEGIKEQKINVKG